MALLKALLFALVAINVQNAFSSPTPNHLQVLRFVEGYLPPLLLPLLTTPHNPDILAIVQTTKGAIAELLEQDQITWDQAKELTAAILAAAAENRLSLISEVDIALEDAVAEEIIDPETKVGILLAALREGLHLDPPETLEEAIEATLDAAVAASVIDEDTADAIMDVVPEEVDPVPDAVVNADDVEAAVADEDDPVGVKDEIREIAEKARDAMNEAAAQGLLTAVEAADIIGQVWDAAKSNDLTDFSEIDIALNAGVEDEIIDDATKVHILVNAVKEGLPEPPISLEDAIAEVVDAAVEAEIIDEDTAEALKDAAPDAVDPDPDATISADDVEEAAEEDEPPPPPPPEIIVTVTIN